MSEQVLEIHEELELANISDKLIGLSDCRGIRIYFIDIKTAEAFMHLIEVTKERIKLLDIEQIETFYNEKDLILSEFEALDIYPIKAINY